VSQIQSGKVHRADDVTLSFGKTLCEREIYGNESHPKLYPLLWTNGTRSVTCRDCLRRTK
jgi:hypothetical protein